jgi:phage shock protein C
MDVYKHEATPQGLYRDVSRRVFTGVCAGLGQHFRVNPNWIRAGFIVGFIFVTPIPLIVYVIASFLMPRYGESPRRWRGRRHRRNHGPQEYHDPDSNYNRYGSTRVRIEDVIAKFDEIENKVRSMEDVVTSKEFTLRQKFRDLNSQ